MEKEHRKAVCIALMAGLQGSEISVGGDEEGERIGSSPSMASMAIARSSDLHAIGYMMHIKLITRLYIDLG
jgi:hypothetical protein